MNMRRDVLNSVNIFIYFSRFQSSERNRVVSTTVNLSHVYIIVRLFPQLFILEKYIKNARLTIMLNAIGNTNM